MLELLSEETVVAVETLRTFLQLKHQLAAAPPITTISAGAEAASIGSRSVSRLDARTVTRLVEELVAEGLAVRLSMPNPLAAPAGRGPTERVPTEADPADGAAHEAGVRDGAVDAPRGDGLGVPIDEAAIQHAPRVDDRFSTFIYLCHIYV